MDRHTAASLDRWITREPDYYGADERELLRCSTCGVYLPDAPDHTVEWVVLSHCDGQPKVIECEHDEQTLAIIGDEHRGRKFKVAYPAACGSMAGSRHATHDGEVSPDDLEKWRHDPHFYVDDWGYQQVAVRFCARGHVNEEVLS